jgi:hypothetical protein
VPGTAEASINEVFDIMGRIPGYLEDADNLRTSSSIAKSSIAFAEHGETLVRQLRSWYDTQLSLNLEPLYWEEDSTFADQNFSWRSQEDYFLNKRLEFKDSVTAHAIVLHWVALLLVYTTHYMNTLHLHNSLGHNEATTLASSKTHLSFSDASNLELLENAEKCALLTAKSIEYFLQPELGGISANMSAFCKWSNVRHH